MCLALPGCSARLVQGKHLWCSSLCLLELCPAGCGGRAAARVWHDRQPCGHQAQHCWLFGLPVCRPGALAGRPGALSSTCDQTARQAQPAKQKQGFLAFMMVCSALLCLWQSVLLGMLCDSTGLQAQASRHEGLCLGFRPCTSAGLPCPSIWSRQAPQTEQPQALGVLPALHSEPGICHQQAVAQQSWCPF